MNDWLYTMLEDDTCQGRKCRNKEKQAWGRINGVGGKAWLRRWPMKKDLRQKKEAFDNLGKNLVEDKTSRMKARVRVGCQGREWAAGCCSVIQSCPAPCDPTECSMPSFPVLHHLLKFAKTHVHWVSDAIQPSHPLLSPSPPALNLAHHQGHFQWVSSLHQVAKGLALQLQHQSFHWIFRVDFL